MSTFFNPLFASISRDELIAHFSTAYSEDARTTWSLEEIEKRFPYLMMIDGIGRVTAPIILAGAFHPGGNERFPLRVPVTRIADAFLAAAEIIHRVILTKRRLH